MTSPQLVPAHPDTHRDALLSINIEYLQWVLEGFGALVGRTPAELVGKAVPDYVAGVIDKVCGDPPPRGIFYLLQQGDAIAGMGGLRWVREGVAEIKRVYIRPAHRGHRIADVLVQRLLDDAQAFGYQHVLLDSAPFMHAAHRMYQRFGFTDRGPYEEVEAPKSLHHLIRFMERKV